MPNTVIEAIKQGVWDYEPPPVGSEDFAACPAMPGTPGKLSTLAERAPGLAAVASE